MWVMAEEKVSPPGVTSATTPAATTNSNTALLAGLSTVNSDVSTTSFETYDFDGDPGFVKVSFSIPILNSAISSLSLLYMGGWASLRIAHVVMCYSLRSAAVDNLCPLSPNTITFSYLLQRVCV